MGRVHTYATTTRWQGSTGVGYDGYERAHEVSAEPVAGELGLSSDPSFRGDPARLNPEQLLVLAASSCQLLSFLAVAARARVDVVGYEDRALGEMPEDLRPMRVARIVLRPRITIRGVIPRDTRLLHLVEVAHRECFIANSLTSEIEIQPSFVRAQG
ncbi:OsmC family protein [Conexibacter sp. JD483]|uniref:OsmC family protein n=1 Tax=unclassified Conexibacter TaxID=2627773 RepID=UPI002723B43C|nr:MULTISPECIES: OsmC family protein [unclassified Conexibacter]MDO8188437.1 OsmC family protein [Conexibacter sp. CPCC 205706]MDO8199202.1 OsmC family protein [Conexibacter sp. CPCC 205762]MDR9372346.1 OsmC family protein [Conexibacter sp. JD483]